MKKFVSIIVSLFLLLNISISAIAAENNTVPENEKNVASIYMEASEKKDFANQMDAIYETALANGEIKSGSRTEIDALMELATFATSDEEKEQIEQELAQYGTYIYNYNEVDFTENAQMRVGSGDVDLARPIIFYESWEKTWTVTCGGNWNSNNWSQGYVGNVGGDEAFGVGYTNTSNTYKSSVVRASAYISDGSNDNNRMVTTSNRSDGDGSKGFGFRLQDYQYAYSLFTDKYVGYKWYGSCTYDANFGSYSGVATAYYIHTYKTAEISSIVFGIQGKTAGINAEITSKENSFPAYSSDKTFGVY